jgi:hypothetical protein
MHRVTKESGLPDSANGSMAKDTEPLGSTTKGGRHVGLDKMCLLMEVHLKGCAKSDELVILWPSSAALSSRLMTSTARLSSTAGFPAAAATPRSEGLGGGTRISRGGVVDAFTRDLELMEVIAAADAVVNARGSGGRGGLVGTRLLLDNPNGRSCRSRNRGGTRSLFSRSSKEGW